MALEAARRPARSPPRTCAGLTSSRRSAIRPGRSPASARGGATGVAVRGRGPWARTVAGHTGRREHTSPTPAREATRAAPELHDQTGPGPVENEERQNGEDQVDHEPSQITQCARDDTDDEARAGEHPLLHCGRIRLKALDPGHGPRADPGDLAQ